MQVPLYNGKNTCMLDPNNYRGITLLLVLNKIIEILIWRRMEDWWVSMGVILNLQGACKKRQSCTHSALLLQETLAATLDDSNTFSMAYFEMAKAFDSVWVEGLLY